jgi:hypothetical protein
VRNCAGLATLGVGRLGGRPRFARLLLRPSRRRQHHFSVSQPTSADKSAFLARWNAINDVLHAIAAWMGRSFSAEHGGGQLKLAADERPGALAVMRAVKVALDWNGVKNLGKLLSLVERPAGAMD